MKMANTVEDRLNDIAEILIKQQTINVKLHNELSAVLKELAAAKEAFAQRDRQITALTEGQGKLEYKIKALATVADLEAAKAAIAEKDEQISALVDAQVQTDKTMIAFATATELKAAQAAIAERDAQIAALLERQVKTETLLRACFISAVPGECSDSRTESQAAPEPALERVQELVQELERKVTDEPARETDSPPSPQLLIDKAHLLTQSIAAITAGTDKVAVILHSTPTPAPEPVQDEVNFLAEPSTASPTGSAGESPITEGTTTREGSYSGARKRERPAEASPKLPWAERLCRFLGM